MRKVYKKDKNLKLHSENKRDIERNLHNFLEQMNGKKGVKKIEKRQS